jgi:hypothetical protein
VLCPDYGKLFRHVIRNPLEKGAILKARDHQDAGWESSEVAQLPQDDGILTARPSVDQPPASRRGADRRYGIPNPLFDVRDSSRARRWISSQGAWSAIPCFRPSINREYYAGTIRREFAAFRCNFR